MKQYQYGVVARFAEGKNVYGGQTIKTRNFTEALQAHVGEKAVYRSDTSGWQKRPFRLVRQICRALARCEEVVILPAHQGVLVIPRLLRLLRGFRKTKLHYVVVGGWLPEFLQKRKGLTRCLKRFDGIYVETESMKAALEKQGFSNVVVLPNFKSIQVLAEDELVYAEGEPYRLCTFSRVLKEKGIEDAVHAVCAVNAALGRVAYTLDIYGRIDPHYEEDFAAFSKDFPAYIRYMGAADGARSTEIIKDYFALLFPTYYHGEGFPGTLLDAFSAGTPAIASDWRYNGEIIGDDKGLLHEAKNVKQLTELLTHINENPDEINSKKQGCLAYAASMKPEKLIHIFCK